MRTKLNFLDNQVICLFNVMAASFFLLSPGTSLWITEKDDFVSQTTQPAATGTSSGGILNAGETSRSWQKGTEGWIW